MPKDFGYFGKGLTGYAQYMTAFNRNNGGGRQAAFRRQRRVFDDVTARSVFFASISLALVKQALLFTRTHARRHDTVIE